LTVLIDIGNSRTKYCYVEKDCNASLSHFAVINNECFNEELFAKDFVNAGNVIVANVATDSLTAKLAKWCKNHKIGYIEVRSEQKKGKVVSAYEEPQQLGVDRWLALLAAEQLYPDRSVLIIDAGTATTVDLLNASGQHIGGWILAGISTLFTSVLNETTKVHAKQAEEISITFGNNTSTNVNNASWAATVGLINQAIRQAKQELNQLDEIILTGGNGKALQKLISARTTQIDELVFYGLNSYN